MEAVEWARFYAFQIFPHHGAYWIILSDRGEQFTANMACKLAHIFQAFHKLSASSHPEFGGIMEHSNCRTIDILCKVLTSLKDWDLYLPFVSLASNTSVQKTTNEAIFFVHHGADTNLPLQTIYSPLNTLTHKDTESYLKETVKGLQLTFTQVRDNMERAMQERAHRHDTNVQPIVYQVGDLVWFHPPRKQDKLDPYWYNVKRRCQQNYCQHGLVETLC
jgi:hypothetical protein